MKSFCNPFFQTYKIKHAVKVVGWGCKNVFFYAQHEENGIFATLSRLLVGTIDSVKGVAKTGRFLCRMVFLLVL